MLGGALACRMQNKKKRTGLDFQKTEKVQSAIVQTLQKCKVVQCSANKYDCLQLQPAGANRSQELSSFQAQA